MCIGKNFAIAEFKVKLQIFSFHFTNVSFLKAILAVLVKNYEFEFRDGRDTKPEIEIVKPLLPRPKLKGEAEVAVPLRIRRIEAN